MLVAFSREKISPRKTEVKFFCDFLTEDFTAFTEVNFLLILKVHCRRLPSDLGFAMTSPSMLLFKPERKI